MSGRRQDRSRDTVLYRLVVAGRLEESWLEWFSADVVDPGDEETVLWVRVADQSELFGRLRRIHDLNLTLLRLTLEPPCTRETSPSEASRTPESEHEGDIP